MRRVFLIVLDSVGIGEMPDAADYGDAGSNTIRAVASSPYFSMPNMRKLGFFNIDGVEIGEKEKNPAGSFARMTEVSKGKDTTIGHWEIISNSPLPTYPNGFPQEILDEFTKRTGRGVLCNKPYSGTDVIRDYGEEHMKTGKLIVYTSADSVFQVAAHEDVVPVETLYEYCKIAREILTGENGVGRVIARPFVGTPGNFTRTVRRHDFSLEPPGKTVLDAVAGKVYRIGSDIGLGSTVKIIHQLLAGVHIAVAAEAMALAARAGIPLETMYDVVTHAAGNSWMFENRMQHVLDGDYSPKSAVDIFVKDLGLVNDTARALTFPLPLATTALNMFTSASNAGFGREDDSAVIKIFNGITLPGHKQ